MDIINAVTGSDPVAQKIGPEGAVTHYSPQKTDRPRFTLVDDGIGAGRTRAMGRKRKARRYQVVFTAKPAGGPGLCERRFWILAFGVVLISVFTRVFDFSLVPLSYNGLFITRPYCGLHSWASANLAWAGRSHVNYGLGYTKGYHTPAVGDPPPAHPRRYVSHPSLENIDYDEWMAVLRCLMSVGIICRIKITILSS